MSQQKLILIIFFIFCILSSILIFLKASHIQQNHYVGLSQTFLQGRLNIYDSVKYSSSGDIAFFNNKYYVYFGPTPAILLLPLVFLFDNKISQQTLTLVLLIIDLVIIYKITKKFQLSLNDRLWMSLFFIFGTIFIFLSLVNTTAYQVQIIGISFLLFAIYEFFYRKNWLLIGFWLALAGSTRFTLYFTSIFFILSLLFTVRVTKTSIRNLFLLTFPLIISILILGYYNYSRFGNIFDTGYAYNASWGKDLKAASSIGIFSLQHVPGNLYFLLFKGPEAVRASNDNFVLQSPYLSAHPWGMGIFFTSPLFLYIFLARLKEKQNLFILLTIGTVLVPILSYYGIGVFQYGYRYALDFYPFLFLLLLSVFKNGLPVFAKVLIVYGAIFNFYLMMSIWGIYPFKV